MKKYMIDIETTGVKDTDEILEVGIVELEFKDGYYHPLRDFEFLLHSDKVPSDDFAKKHMSHLYDLCNNQDKKFNTNLLTSKIQEFLHASDKDPKMFMGWNASMFDVPFLLRCTDLVKAYRDEKNKLVGDIHYRVHEQQGSLQALCDASGFSPKAILPLLDEINPVGISLPEGKIHRALYDCYLQIIKENAIIYMNRNIKLKNYGL